MMEVINSSYRSRENLSPACPRPDVNVAATYEAATSGFVMVARGGIPARVIYIIPARGQRLDRHSFCPSQ
jgi:hypothetical protein